MESLQEYDPTLLKKLDCINLYFLYYNFLKKVIFSTTNKKWFYA